MNYSSSASGLTIGDPAPDFSLYTHAEEPWRLSDHRNGPVVLLFFPGAFTSVCTDELKRVDTEFDAFGTAHVVGLSTDSPFVLSAFREELDLGFPLLSDHDAEVCAQYGAKYDHDFTEMQLDRIAKRSAFVVDQGGKIRYAEVLDNAGRQPDLQAVANTIDGLSPR